MRALVLVLVLVSSGCFSAFNVTRYRAPAASAGSIQTIAVPPLIIVAATETQSTLSYAPGWYLQTSVTLPMSPAEYEPAQQATLESLRSSLSRWTIVPPAEVDKVMSGSALPQEKAMLGEIAKRTNADAVLIVRVRNFNQRPAALENAQASGTMDMTLYTADGSVIWSLVAEVVRGPAGSNAAPSLAQFMDYALDKFKPEVDQMMSAP
jgi:hypothetical protein